MPAPTNISAATATGLTIPSSITQDVNDAGTTYTVWYSYTALAGDTVIGLFAYGDDTNYFVRVKVYTEPAGAPVAYLAYNSAPPALDRPIQVPVTPGETYFFEFISEDGNVTPALLTLSTAHAPDTDPAVGDIFINDEKNGYPLAVLAPATGEPKKFVTGTANGEFGALLTNGRYCLEDRFRDRVIVYAGTTVIAAVAFANEPASFVSVSSNRADTFYLGNQGSGATAAFVTTIDEDGNAGPTTWTLPSSGLWGMVPALDDTILYWAENAVGEPIQRFDLVNDLALSDLVAGIANYRPTADMFVLADGSILVGYLRNATTNPSFIVKQYSAVGATLNTYNFNFLSTTSVRMAIGTDPDSFWLKRHTSGGGVELLHIRVSDGATLATLTSFEYENGKSTHTYALTTTVPFGNAPSCPFLVMSALAAETQDAIQDLSIPCPCPDTPATGSVVDPVGTLPAPTFTCTGGAPVEEVADLPGLEDCWL